MEPDLIMLKALLKGRQGASILPETDRPPVILVKAPLEREQLKGMPVGYGEVELYDYIPEGPVVRMLLRLFDNPEEPMEFDIFLNPGSEADRRILERLSKTQYIEIDFYGADDELPYLGSKRLNWKTEHRVGASTILSITSGKTTQWPAAKERCMRENPLGELR